MIARQQGEVRSGVLRAHDSPIPAKPGVYTWNFDELPPGVPTALDAAESLLDNAASEKPTDWIANFDEASLVSEAAQCFLDLADGTTGDHSDPVAFR